MEKTHFLQAFDQEITLSRELGRLEGKKSGPTLIFIGGIHGNEPSGVVALNHILKQYKEKVERLNGKLFAFAGNIEALSVGKRFVEKDLNRLWLDEQVDKILEGRLNGAGQQIDVQEQKSLLDSIRNVLKNESGPFYFFDLHTTSSPSESFILINDTLKNRSLAERFPSKIILGIEEYIEGPLLSYINDQGYVSLGFEAGQHNDIVSLERCKEFIQQAMLLTGLLRDRKLYRDLIRSKRNNKKEFSFYEVRHRYHIKEEESFEMNQGYSNFTRIKKGETLAKNQEGAIQAIEKGYLFMPLYQNQGQEGFYIINIIPKFWLRFSSFLRKINLDNLLLVLPGVKRYDERFKTLVVDARIARFMRRDIFHLLGYRRTQKTGHQFLYIKRELINPKSILKTT